MATWRRIPGHATYEANASGDIRHVREGRAPRTLSQSIKEDGYRRVEVWIGGKRVWRPVHRLVCLAFHGPQPSDDAMACHADGDKGNNTPPNVYWGTALSNYEDAVRHGTARRVPLSGISDEALREWFKRDGQVNRDQLSLYEWGNFGGVRTAKQRTAMRKAAKSKGY
ncbi:HNH endonuclease [Nitratireductor aquimarinus]|nr:HNH endonuclease [Nitratireductor aquimarinus]MBY6130309.1 HNH endonuclease [Nitratireductor aquimarinus]MCA1305062.1 HNH endonuclease [Nitratireductor aquimarinus]